MTDGDGVGVLVSVVVLDADPVPVDVPVGEFVGLRVGVAEVDELFDTVLETGGVGIGDPVAELPVVDDNDGVEVIEKVLVDVGVGDRVTEPVGVGVDVDENEGVDVGDGEAVTVFEYDADAELACRTSTFALKTCSDAATTLEGSGGGAAPHDASSKSMPAHGAANAMGAVTW